MSAGQDPHRQYERKQLAWLLFSFLAIALMAAGVHALRRNPIGHVRQTIVFRRLSHFLLVLVPKLEGQATNNDGPTYYLVSIPSLRILACSVVRFMPSLAAAPCIAAHPAAGVVQRLAGSPPVPRPPASPRSPAAGAALQFAHRNLQGAPGERITARSMKFCSSRMFPGQ